jgi:SAM-dependent methyltransferase
MGVIDRARRMAAALRAGEVVPSPNIWHWPQVYETENRAQDVHGEIWSVLREVCDWTGRDVVDVGCGDGFHLPGFAADARLVVGVEPHPPLADLPDVRVVGGSAQALPLPDGSADVVHARTAYFFGPGCEPGLAQAQRVLRPGGVLVIVDLDVAAAPYGDWMRQDLPDYRPSEITAFFAAQGFDCRHVHSTWRFENREDLEAVLRIEFSPQVAGRAIAEVTGLSFPVGYRVHVRRKPQGLYTRG